MVTTVVRIRDLAVVKLRQEGSSSCLTNSRLSAGQIMLQSQQFSHHGFHQFEFDSNFLTEFLRLHSTTLSHVLYSLFSNPSVQAGGAAVSLAPSPIPMTTIAIPTYTQNSAAMCG